MYACLCRCVCTCMYMYMYVYIIYTYWKNKTPSRRACPALKKRYEKRVGPFFEKVTRKVKEQSWCTLSCCTIHDRFDALSRALLSCRDNTSSVSPKRKMPKKRKKEKTLLIRASFLQGDSSKEFSSLYRAILYS